MKLLRIAVAALLALLSPQTAAAAPPPEQVAIDYAQWLIDHNQTKQARELLKEQLVLFPSSRALTVLLAVTYVKDDNPFWANNTLTAHLQRQPNDCEARLWLAWSYLHVASLDKAEEALDDDSCRGTGPLATRAALVRALIADVGKNEGSARQEIGQARKQEQVFQHDEPALRALSEKIEPERLPEVAWQVEARRGYTSNALLGSPIDPSASKETASSFLQTNTWFRISPDLRSFLRPSLELQARVFKLLDKDLEGQSYINPTGRMGLYLNESLPRALLAYRPDYMRLSGGDSLNPGPLWYVAAHRGEIELELSPSVLFFAGTGKRTFRPVVRNRIELDGGLGGQVGLGKGLGLVWAVSGRKHWTEAGPYNVVGTTGIGSLNYTFDAGWQVRAVLTLAGDYYADSAGYFNADRPEDKRRDLFVKSGLALWSPALSGLRTAFAYDFSHRDSSAPAYEFSDHRFTMLIAWTGTADLSGPARSSQRPLANLPWDFGSGKAKMKERVQELLRQDEQTLQRSCGCRE